MLRLGRFGPGLAGRQRGFSYSEVLVSLALVAVGVLGFSLNTVSVMQGSRRSAHYAVAANLAQDKLEQLKVQPSLTDVNHCPDGGERSITAAGMPDGIYDRCWTIKDSSVGSGLKEIAVVVSWRESGVRNVTLSTLVVAE